MSEKIKANGAASSPARGKSKQAATRERIPEKIYHKTMLKCLLAAVIGTWPTYQTE